MLASFIISLEPIQTAPVGNSLGASLHGLFFNLLREGDAALARRVHDADAVKPFTVSPLNGKLPRVAGERMAVAGLTYWARFTTLTEEVYHALNPVLLGRFLRGGAVTLDGVEFKVVDVATEPREEKRFGRLSSAEEIWVRAQPESNITLRFASPTTFKQRGLNLMFPIPANVFHSYRERWNAFTPYPVDEGFIPWAEQNVAVEAHHLQTRMIWFGEFQLHGFTGWCRFTTKDKDAARLKQLNALADFAFFCGTGQKTTQGMGQTRRIREERIKLKDDEG
jgi:CRISPR-associated endoribonuclease Cas6